MADSSITEEQQEQFRLVLYQVSLGLALVAINHRAIQVALAQNDEAIEIDSSGAAFLLLTNVCFIYALNQLPRF